MTRFFLLSWLLVGLALSDAHAQILYNTVEVTSPASIAGDYAGGSGFWGVSLPDVGPISGEVVLADDGFDPVTDGCDFPYEATGKIALVDRGTCNLVRKPFVAGLAGAIAVIIINDRPGEVPYQSGGYEGVITIPTVFVTQEVGALLKANLDGLEVTLRGSELEITTSECVAGRAGAFACDRVNLESNLARSVFVTPESPAPQAANDIWGWTDPETGREYALVGLTNGTAFVDVTVPTAPVYLGKLPTTTDASTWRDIKTYANHAFIVSEAAGHGMQVFDLTRLRTASGSPVTFTADALYTGITSAHNIVINEGSGFAYAVGARASGGLPAECDARGLHAIDISTPTSPTFASCFSDRTQDVAPVIAPGYTHDAQCVMYAGPDADHTGKEICLASNEDVVAIFDVSDKAAVQLLSQVAYPNAAYTHQGWLTDDHRYFVVNDELDELNFGGLTRTIVFDLVDLDDPEFSFIHSGPSEASDHNLYVHNGRVFQSNYRAGLRVLDASDVAGGLLTEIASFDTWPESDQVGTTGQWSNYPYFPSGTVVVNDTRGGLFVLSLAEDPNRPPVAVAAGPETVVAGQLVTLDGSGSSDPDDDDLTYAWTLNGPGYTDAPLTGETPTFCAAEATSPGGPYTATLVVNDGTEDSANDAVVTVTAISATAALDALLADVEALRAADGLNRGQANALSVKLRQAQRLLGRGQTAEALAVLAGFRQQALDLEADGVLSDTERAALVAAVDAVTVALSAPCSATASAASAAGPAPAALQAEPVAFGLSAPYPNPATGRATVAFAVEETADVRLAVYDALGREVAVLVDRTVEAGRHTAVLDGAALPTGTYLVRLTAGALSATQRLTLLR